MQTSLHGSHNGHTDGVGQLLSNNGASFSSQARSDAATFSFAGDLRGALAWSRGGDILYVADTGFNCIRRIYLRGSLNVSTIAGNPAYLGSSDGLGTSAKFDKPTDISLGPDESYALVIDGDASGRIRRILLTGSTPYAVTTLVAHDSSLWEKLAGIVHVSASTAIFAARRSVHELVIETGAIHLIAGNSSGLPGPEDGMGASSTFVGIRHIDAVPGGSTVLVADKGTELHNVFRRVSFARTTAGLIRSANVTSIQGANGFGNTVNRVRGIAMFPDGTSPDTDPVQQYNEW